jgi:acyl-CoA reductase-like NAD-dependent aldehyde dehydrogenase
MTKKGREAAQDATMLRVSNPADGYLIAEVRVDTPESIALKVKLARAAQEDWADRPLSERIACLLWFKQLVEERRPKLAQILTDETGKPIRQSTGELTALVPRIDYFIEQVRAVLATESVLEDAKRGLAEEIAHEPLGVIANVSAWNYPWFVGANVFVPALLTGNAVLYKPSEHATLTGLAIGELMREVGVPEDVFGVVVGAGDVGAALVAQPVDGVFFTGSYATGAKIAAQVAPRMVKLQLECGGKDAVYVCDDADVAKAAASLAQGAFHNAGQSCCSVERIYVHERIHDAFVQACVAAVRAFVVGPPRDSDTYIGPLARGAQLDLLEAQVADALAKGAKLATGGKRLPGPGHWFEPTVLVDVDHRMAVMREESFGPIVGIQRVRGDAQAHELMSDSEYGLTAGVYTPDEARARRLLARMRTGSVYWNCCDRVSPRLPWSGTGHSGVGVTLSREGIRAFTRPKAWHMRAG